MANEWYARGGEAGPVIVQGGTISFDAASCGSAAITLQTVTIAGARPGDVVLFIPPAGGLSVAVQVGVGYVSANDTVKVPFCNPTAAALDPGTATFDYVIISKPGLS
ncbi:MAG TPA: hypothetical protein VHL05_12435 [Terriglobales bacterium]|jgi:hypothetical protein|nr:hypothetical protein [Terriglobales bacterium]